MYIAAIASLLTVTIFGQKYLGARRWIKMPGGGHFQPSEWVKLILILAVAKYFADLHQRELSWPDFMKAGAIVGIPMLLVLAQPDLGTALTYIPIAVMGLFLGGVRWQAGSDRCRAGRAHDAARLARAETLSARPADQLYGTRGGQPGIGVPSNSITYSGRFRWNLGQQRRLPDPSVVSCLSHKPTSSLRLLPRNMDSWAH